MPKKAPPNSVKGRFTATRTPAGMGSLSHKPKVLNNPSSLSGRRAASHAKAYPA